VKGKFSVGDVVVHKTTGGVYKINLTPDLCLLEETAKPAYGYTKVNEDEFSPSPMWIREAREMEDGRFIKMEKQEWEENEQSQ